MDLKGRAGADSRGPRALQSLPEQVGADSHDLSAPELAALFLLPERVSPVAQLERVFEESDFRAEA